MARIFLGLGSNLGDRPGMLTRARTSLAGRGMKVIRASFVLDNKALIIDDQPDFLNQVLEVETTLAPLELLDALKEIETTLGRKPRERYGPREIDIDILSYEGVQMKSERLTLPHPGLKDRPYLRTLLEDLGTSPESLLEGR